MDDWTPASCAHRAAQAPVHGNRSAPGHEAERRSSRSGAGPSIDRSFGRATVPRQDSKSCDLLNAAVCWPSFLVSTRPASACPRTAESRFVTCPMRFCNWSARHEHGSTRRSRHCSRRAVRDPSGRHAVKNATSDERVDSCPSAEHPRRLSRQPVSRNEDWIQIEGARETPLS